MHIKSFSTPFAPPIMLLATSLHTQDVSELNWDPPKPTQFKSWERYSYLLPGLRERRTFWTLEQQDLFANIPFLYSKLYSRKNHFTRSFLFNFTFRVVEIWPERRTFGVLLFSDGQWWVEEVPRHAKPKYHSLPKTKIYDQFAGLCNPKSKAVFGLST